MSQIGRLPPFGWCLWIKVEKITQIYKKNLPPPFKIQLEDLMPIAIKPRGRQLTNLRFHSSSGEEKMRNNFTFQHFLLLTWWGVGYQLLCGSFHLPFCPVAENRYVDLFPTRKLHIIINILKDAVPLRTYYSLSEGMNDLNKMQDPWLLWDCVTSIKDNLILRTSILFEGSKDFVSKLRSKLKQKRALND